MLRVDDGNVKWKSIEKSVDKLYCFIENKINIKKIYSVNTYLIDINKDIIAFN